MMYKKVLVCLGIPLFLTGCAGIQAARNISPTDETNVIDFSRSIIIGMSNKLDKIVARRSNSEKDHGNFRTFYGAFFPTEGGAIGVIQSYRSYCSSIGGVFNTEPTVACFSPLDLDHPLFHVKIESERPQIDQYIRVYLHVSEPKSKQYKNDPRYITHINEQGFLNEANRNRLATQKINDLVDKEKAELDKKQAAQRLLAEEQRYVTAIGTEICQAGRGNIYFVGYVDQYSNGKIRVLVNSAHRYKQPNYTVGGFTPSTIWDSPQNWRLCNTFQ